MTRSPDRDRLAVLVHEVRSPVAALGAIAEAYREADASTRRSLAALALAACSGIERIVSDLQVASVVRERVDVGRVAEEAASAAALRGGTVRTEIRPELPEVEADPHRLRQAIDNLIANALTHAPEADVLVAVRSAGTTLTVSVTDRGHGIPFAEQARIFEAGVRLDATRPGSGLGLAIARAIAAAHGGTLAVESTAGQGATFTLSLPLE